MDVVQDLLQPLRVHPGIVAQGPERLSVTLQFVRQLRPDIGAFQQIVHLQQGGDNQAHIPGVRIARIMIGLAEQVFDP